VATEDDYQLLPHIVTAKARDYQRGITPLHRHPRAQLIYAGSGVMRIETAVGCWVVPPLRGVWVPAQTDHRVVMLGQVQMRTLYIRTEARPDLPDTCCLVEVGQLLRALIFALLEEPVDYDLDGRGRLLAELALRELRFLRLPALHLPMPTEARLQKACNRVLATLDTQETLDDLADYCGTTSRTMARLFSAQTGLSFRQWRQQARLVEALGQLCNGAQITQVAEQLGYQSASAFTAMFKRSLGVEPRRYFEQLNTENVFTETRK
jgi:AraC-like DNA-binding protein